MTLILLAFGIVGIPESVGDWALYQHGATLTGISYWDAACWLGIALVYKRLRELADGR